MINRDQAKSFITFIGESGDILESMTLHAIEGVIHERDRLVRNAKSSKEIERIEKTAKDVMWQYITTFTDLCEQWYKVTGDSD